MTLVCCNILSFLLICNVFLQIYSFNQVYRKSYTLHNLKMEIFEGNPVGKFIWDQVWKLPLLQPGKPGVSPTSFGDGANVIKSNIIQVYGKEPSFDGAPIAVGEVDGLLEGSLFLGLRTYYENVSHLLGMLC